MNQPDDCKDCQECQTISCNQMMNEDFRDSLGIDLPHGCWHRFFGLDPSNISRKQLGRYLSGIVPERGEYSTTAICRMANLRNERCICKDYVNQRQRIAKEFLPMDKLACTFKFGAVRYELGKLVKDGSLIASIRKMTDSGQARGYDKMLVFSQWGIDAPEPIKDCQAEGIRRNSDFTTDFLKTREQIIKEAN